MASISPDFTMLISRWSCVWNNYCYEVWRLGEKERERAWRKLLTIDLKKNSRGRLWRDRPILGLCAKTALIMSKKRSIRMCERRRRKKRRETE